MFEAELSLFRELDDRRGVAWAIFGLGFVTLNRDDDTRAAEHFAETLPYFEALGDRWGLGLALANLGRSIVRQGDDARAAVLFGRALGIAWELGDRWATAHVLEDVGCLAARAGRAEAAARLLGAADALRAADGIQLSPLHRTGHAVAIAAAQAGRGEEGLAAAWAAGRMLTVEAAVAAAFDALADLEQPPGSSEASEPADGPRLTRRERPDYADFRTPCRSRPWRKLRSPPDARRAAGPQDRTVLILAAAPALPATGARRSRSGDVAADVEVDIVTLQLLSPDLGHGTSRLSCARMATPMSFTRSTGSIE
jgi:hypothetical protein